MKSVDTEYFCCVHFMSLMLMVYSVMYSLLCAEYRGLNFYSSHCFFIMLRNVLHDVVILCCLVTVYLCTARDICMITNLVYDVIL